MVSKAPAPQVQVNLTPPRKRKRVKQTIPRNTLVLISIWVGAPGRSPNEFLGLRPRPPTHISKVSVDSQIQNTVQLIRDQRFRSSEFRFQKFRSSELQSFICSEVQKVSSERSEVQGFRSSNIQKVQKLRKVRGSQVQKVQKFRSLEAQNVRCSEFRNSEVQKFRPQRFRR